MARRTKGKAKDPDPDFKIYVDPSCLSAPMDEETTATPPISNEDKEEEKVVPEQIEATVDKHEGDIEPEADNKIQTQEDVLSTEDMSRDDVASHDGHHVLDTADDSILDAEADPNLADGSEGEHSLLSDTHESEVGRDEEDAEADGDHSLLSATHQSEVDPDMNDAEADDDRSMLSAHDSDVGEEQSADGTAADDSHLEEDASVADITDDSVAIHNDDEIEESTALASVADEEEDQSKIEERSILEEPDNEASELVEESLVDEPGADEASHMDEASQVEDPEHEAEHVEPEEDFMDDDDDTPRPTQRPDEDEGQSFVEESPSSRRQSEASDRRTSLRTEALIQAAARAVMAKIEHRGRDSNADTEYQEQGNDSVLSTAHTDDEPEGSEATYDADTSANTSRRESSESTVHHPPPAPRSLPGDDGGDSSSQHEHDDDDVFSDNHSGRSSLSGSLSGGHSGEERLKSPTTDAGFRDSFIRSPRMSGISIISGLSQYEKDEAEFVPTARETPRVPFRTPSSVRALQMSSPTPSVIAGSTPRSHQKKRSQGGNSPFPTISRLGSPVVSAQYSPKGRTPTRFKPRQEAPLVLLHVTLLPLRWMWADVIDNLDAVTGKDGRRESGSESSSKFDPSVELRALRDAWRQLQDRVGDTVLERGILLPHPQNDYEILEERLLEALDLPLRRRARILECGHYIGPTNLTADDELSQDESEDEYRPQSRFSTSQRDKRHWCGTCKGEIRFEDLGPGRVFRVKVYASNGLMKAGAWEACWKEMERVDIEVEPIVESTLQSELEKLAAIQVEMEEARHREEEEDLEAMEHDEQQTLPTSADREAALLERREYMTPCSPTVASPPGPSMHITMHASPLRPPPTSALRPHASYDSLEEPSRFSSPARPGSAMSTEPIDRSEARRIRDEERLREIYGDDNPHETPLLQVPSQRNHHVPSPSSSMHAEPASAGHRHPDSYIPPPTPRSPSEEAYERREAREQLKRPYQSASLPELLLEVVKVLMRDPKNVAIAFLAVLTMFFMLRTAPPEAPPSGLGHYEPRAEASVAMGTPIAATPSSIALESTVSQEESVSMSTSTETVVVAPSPPPAPAKSKERKVVRVVETVTETVSPEIPAETVYETETIKVTVSAPAPASTSSADQQLEEDEDEELAAAVETETETEADAKAEAVPIHDEI